MVENPSPKMIANPDYGGDVYAYDFEAVGFELWTVNPIPSPCPISHRTAPHRIASHRTACELQWPAAGGGVELGGAVRVNRQAGPSARKGRRVIACRRPAGEQQHHLRQHPGDGLARLREVLCGLDVGQDQGWREGGEGGAGGQGQAAGGSAPARGG